MLDRTWHDRLPSRASLTVDDIRLSLMSPAWIVRKPFTTGCVYHPCDLLHHIRLDAAMSIAAWRLLTSMFSNELCHSSDRVLSFLEPNS